MMDGKGKVVNREYNPARLGVHLHHGMRMAYEEEDNDAGANYRAPYYSGQKCGGGIREVTYFHYEDWARRNGPLKQTKDERVMKGDKESFWLPGRYADFIEWEDEAPDECFWIARKLKRLPDKEEQEANRVPQPCEIKNPWLYDGTDDEWKESTYFNWSIAAKNLRIEIAQLVAEAWRGIHWQKHRCAEVADLVCAEIIDYRYREYARNAIEYSSNNRSRIIMLKAYQEIRVILTMCAANFREDEPDPPYRRFADNLWTERVLWFLQEVCAENTVNIHNCVERIRENCELTMARDETKFGPGEKSYDLVLRECKHVLTRIDKTQRR